jgi:hypothetical protein
MLVDIAASGNSIQKVITPALRGFIETRARFALLVLNPSSRQGSFCVGILPTIIFY